MSFGESFRAGMSLGMSSARTRMENDRLKRAQEDEDLLNEARSAMFSDSPEHGPATAAPTDSGLGPQSSGTNYLGQLNHAVSRGLNLLKDPKYARISDKLFTEIGKVTESSGKFRDAMYAEARDNAMPYLREYYTPGMDPQRKAKALGGLLSTVLPNGRQYEVTFQGDNVAMKDDLGRTTVMPAKAIDMHIQRMLQNPDDFMTGINASIADEAKRAREDQIHTRDRTEKAIDAEAAQRIKLEDEARAERRTIAAEGRAQGRDLADEDRTRGRQIEQENRAAMRSTQLAREKFIAQGMQAFDSGMVATGKDVTREQYLATLQRAAKENFKDPQLFDTKTGRPLGLPQPDPGAAAPGGRTSRYGAVGSTITVGAPAGASKGAPANDFQMGEWKPNPKDRRYNPETGKMDGPQKGMGYFGPLKRPDGGVSTELSIGMMINGKETEIPSLVPTLSADEVHAVLNSKPGEKFPDSVYQKAETWALDRIASGRSPWATPEEEGKFKPGGMGGPPPPKPQERFEAGKVRVQKNAIERGGEAVKDFAASGFGLPALGHKIGQGVRTSSERDQDKSDIVLKALEKPEINSQEAQFISEYATKTPDELKAMGFTGNQIERIFKVHYDIQHQDE